MFSLSSSAGRAPFKLDHFHFHFRTDNGNISRPRIRLPLQYRFHLLGGAGDLEVI